MLIYLKFDLGVGIWKFGGGLLNNLRAEGTWT